MGRHLLRGFNVQTRPRVADARQAFRDSSVCRRQRDEEMCWRRGARDGNRDCVAMPTPFAANGLAEFHAGEVIHIDAIRSASRAVVCARVNHGVGARSTAEFFNTIRQQRKSANGHCTSKDPCQEPTKLRGRDGGHHAEAICATAMMGRPGAISPLAGHARRTYLFIAVHWRRAWRRR